MPAVADDKDKIFLTIPIAKVCTLRSLLSSVALPRTLQRWIMRSIRPEYARGRQLGLLLFIYTGCATTAWASWTHSGMVASIIRCSSSASYCFKAHYCVISVLNLFFVVYSLLQCIPTQFVVSFRGAARRRATASKARAICNATYRNVGRVAPWAQAGELTHTTNARHPPNTSSPGEEGPILPGVHSVFAQQKARRGRAANSCGEFENEFARARLLGLGFLCHFFVCCV